MNKAGTTTTVTAAPNPSQFNEPVSLKATVKSTTGAIPTGNIIFKDGTTTLGTVSLTSGAGSLSISSLAVGAHSIAAVYGGGANFTASTSAAVTHTVNKAATSSALTSTPNPSNSGQAVTFTAKVTGTFGGIRVAPWRSKTGQQPSELARSAQPRTRPSSLSLHSRLARTTSLLCIVETLTT